MRIDRLITIALFICAGGAQADVRFACPAQVVALQQEVPAWLRSLDIGAAQFVQSMDVGTGALTISLTTPVEDTRTLNFIDRPGYALATEQVRLPAARGKWRKVATVSRKEIALALLQHGRTIEFTDQHCSLDALVDHVGVRQNIVAWAENLYWVWPDGGPAKWNPKYWKRGTPKPGVQLHVAIMDVFLNQDKYAFGCYTAAKIVVVQGMLDYYRRVRPDPERARRVATALLADGEPLVGIEPGRMWSFEKDFDLKELDRPGKLLTLHAEVAPDNFVPGDWGYLLNTDPGTDQKTGYEGSNAIYMGRNQFDDFYNDHWHSYTYEQKLEEVYQWRNGVFSRVRDAGKVQQLTAQERIRLSSLPSDGGIQLGIRVGPTPF